MRKILAELKHLIVRAKTIHDAQYSTGAATTARGVLTGTYNWSITDGGQN
jgi:hypothetical protein